MVCVVAEKMPPALLFTEFSISCTPSSAAVSICWRLMLNFVSAKPITWSMRFSAFTFSSSKLSIKLYTCTDTKLKTPAMKIIISMSDMKAASPLGTRHFCNFSIIGVSSMANSAPMAIGTNRVWPNTMAQITMARISKLKAAIVSLLSGSVIAVWFGFAYRYCCAKSGNASNAKIL